MIPSSHIFLTVFMFLDGYPSKVESKSQRGLKRYRAEETPQQQTNPATQEENHFSFTNRNCQTLPNSSIETQCEGKFLIQVSFEKLRQVEDHESCLRRSVLINNTLKLVHNELYGVKMPFGLTTAMSMNLDANISGNLPLPPSRKRKKRIFNEANSDACLCSRKINEPHQNYVQNCNENCTLSQALYTEELEDEVFQNDCLHSEKEPSIFSELDSVFHSFVCALET